MSRLQCSPKNQFAMFTKPWQAQRPNSCRNTEMVRHLKEIREQIMIAQNPESFLPRVREAEETMLHGNEGWCVVMRFHELEPPA